MATPRKKHPKKAGRRTKYDPRLHPFQVADLIREGKTEAQAAKFLRISDKTFYNWKQEHPEFLQAIEKARRETVGAVVGKLYELALGSEHIEVSEQHEKGTGPNGLVDKRIKKKAKRVVLPNMKAIQFILTNVDPKRWKNNPADDGQDEEAPPLNITVSVSPPVGEVNVTRGEGGDGKG